MKLYEIDDMLRQAVAAACESVDENGNILDDWAEFLDAVQMERDHKALNVAAMERELQAEASAIKAEIKRLSARARTVDNAADRLKSYLATFVSPGEKLKDHRVTIGWRKSAAVVIDDESALPESCFRVVREVSKTEVKKGIEDGYIKTGAHIEERQNIQVR